MSERVIAAVLHGMDYYQIEAQGPMGLKRLDWNEGDFESTYQIMLERGSCQFPARVSYCESIRAGLTEQFANVAAGIVRELDAEATILDNWHDNYVVGADLIVRVGGETFAIIGARTYEHASVSTDAGSLPFRVVYGPLALNRTETGHGPYFCDNLVDGFVHAFGKMLDRVGIHAPLDVVDDRPAE